MTIKPFSPAEAAAAKINFIPQEIIQAVNELLAERYKDHGDITMTLKDVKQRCKEILNVDSMTSEHNPMDAWKNNVWDFESIYREQGWKVLYDGPAFNESYDGYYEFTKERS